MVVDVESLARAREAGGRREARRGLSLVFKSGLFWGLNAWRNERRD